MPIVPFLGFGPALEAWLESAIERTVDPVFAAALVVGLLGVDVFLPIPSSVLSTLGGEVLGFWGGTAASFAGLSLGAAVGFGLARAAARPLVRRLAAPEDLERIGRLSRRLGTAVLIVTRPVPILAEAAVVFFGAAGLPWRRFLPPVTIVNLVIAAAYSALGRWATCRQPCWRRSSPPPSPRGSPKGWLRKRATAEISGSATAQPNTARRATAGHPPARRGRRSSPGRSRSGKRDRYPL